MVCNDRDDRLVIERLQAQLLQKTTNHCMTDSLNAVSRNVMESGKVIQDPHQESEQHQNLITPGWSRLARAYHVW